MSMFEKMKLWMMTPEAKEKYLLEKEKSERKKERNSKNEEVNVTDSKGQESKAKAKDKGKGKSKGANVTKKVVVVKKPKLSDNPHLKKNQEVKESDDSNITESTSSTTESTTSADSKDDKKVKKGFGLGSLKDQLKSRKGNSDSKSEDKDSSLEEDKSTEKLDDYSDQDSDSSLDQETSSNDSMDDMQRMREAEEEERRKRELVEKKLNEKERYLDIMIDLPPTSNVDQIIKNAFNAGIPEWFLREAGYIKETVDEGFEDDFILKESEELDSKEVESESEVQEVQEAQNTEIDNSSVEGISPVEVSTNVDEDSSRGKEIDLTDNIAVNDDINEKSNPVEEIKDEVQLDTSVSKSSDEKPKENSNLNKKLDLADRLKKLANRKVKREVFNVEGDEMLVKIEEEDHLGNKKSNFERYKIDEEKRSDLEVGKELNGDFSFEKVEESKTIIGGEEYNISEEEEEKIVKAISKKEIWIVSSNGVWIQDLKSRFKGTSYNIFPVRNEKDFLLATRNTENTVIITQEIPNNVKSSIGSYLKYLEIEKKNSRLVSIISSPVRAEVIEKLLEDITVDELDSYYFEFDSSRYSKTNKNLFEILKSISFDITDNLSDTINVNSVEEKDNTRQVELNLDLDVDLVVKNEVKRDQKGDFVLDLDENIEIDTSNKRDVEIDLDDLDNN